MVSREYECIYIHIPKCAGTTIETYFDNLEGWHGGFGWYEKRRKREWAEFFKFSCVRNPWDWFVSLHRYWSRMTEAEWFHTVTNQKGKKHRQDWYNKTVPTFKVAIEKMPMLFQSTRTETHFWRQSGFIFNDRDELQVDYLIRIDDFNAGFRHVLETVGAPVVEPRPMNRIEDGGHHYSAWYTDRMAKAVGEFYKRDVDLLGYEFERVEDPNKELYECMTK